MTRLRRGKVAVNLTIAAALELWVKHLEARARSPLTVAHYRRCLAHVLRILGDLRLTDITSAGVDRYLLARRETGIAPTTRRAEYHALVGLLNFAERSDYLVKSPLRGVPQPTVPQRTPPGFTQDELKRIFAACDPRTIYGVRDRALFATLYGTGLRVSELCNLKRADVERETIRIKGKGDKDRLVALQPSVREAIGRYLAVRGDDGEPALWIGHRGVLTPSGIGQICRTYGTRTGIDKIHPHRFRRAALVSMLRGGLDWEQTKRVGGHESDMMLRHYVGHAEMERAAEALMQLDHVAAVLVEAKRPRGRPRKQK